MALLYRYLSAEHALKSIQENRYRVSPLGSLNDVFDCAPRFVPSEGSADISPQKNEDIHDAFLNNIGVICFSTKDNDPLLWAHYGSGYSGIALGFESDELLCEDKKAWFPGTDEKNLLKGIDYSSEDRPKIYEQKLSELGGADSAEGRAYILEGYLKKGPSWIYEAEVRFFVPFAACDPNSTELFFPFSSTALKKVILGPKCNLSPMLVGRSIAAKNYHSAQILKAIPDDDRFALKFEDHWR